MANPNERPDEPLDEQKPGEGELLSDLGLVEYSLNRNVCAWFSVHQPEPNANRICLIVRCRETPRLNI